MAAGKVMLYNEERPCTFDSFVGQNHIVESIRQQSIQQKFFGVYVFSGHFGCGKTSMARLIGLASNCEHLDENGNPCLKCKHCQSILNNSAPDIVEVDAATNTGVDSIRSLRETVDFVPLELKRKIYIIDEVHMLSKGAFNALLKVLEEPPQYVTFILCTTEIKAVPATIRSRAAAYNFEQLTHEELTNHLNSIAPAHEIELDSDASILIAKYAQGAARNALSILDQVSSVSKHVTADVVRNMLGISEEDALYQLIDNLLKSKTMDSIDIVERLIASGKDFYLLCDDLIEIATDALLYKIGGPSVINNVEGYKIRLKKLEDDVSSETLCMLVDALHTLKDDLRKIPGKTTVIHAIIKMTMDTNSSVLAMTTKIAKLEKQINSLMSGNIQCNDNTKIVASSVNEDSSKNKSEGSNSNTSTVTTKPGDEEESTKVEKTKEPCEKSNSDKENVVTSSEKSEKKESNSSKKDSNLPKARHEKKSIEHEQKKESESSLSYDIFDMLAGFGQMTEQVEHDEETNEEIHLENTESDTLADNESVLKSECSQEELQDAMNLIETIANENPVFKVALKGCIIDKLNDGIHIDANIQVVNHLLGLYLESYKNKGISNDYILINQ